MDIHPSSFSDLISEWLVNNVHHQMLQAEHSSIIWTQSQEVCVVKKICIFMHVWGCMIGENQVMNLISNASGHDTLTWIFIHVLSRHYQWSDSRSLFNSFLTLFIFSLLFSKRCTWICLPGQKIWRGLEILPKSFTNRSKTTKRKKQW